jgi:peptidylprolyl isomerase
MDEHCWQQTNSVGTLSMANTGEPNTGGSQFFVNLAHNKFLDFFNSETTSNHVVFGKVFVGLDVVQHIGCQDTGKSDRPREPIRVKRVSIQGADNDPP